MKRLSLLSFVAGCLATVPGLAGAAASAGPPTLHFRYVSVDAALPEGFDFFDPVSISDSRRVYGTLYAIGPAGLSSSVAFYDRGEITALHEGVANTANNHRWIGGAVVVDPNLGTTQAALFKGSAVELIPPLTDDEFTSQVSLLTNSGIALVDSFDSDFNLSQYLTRGGNVTPLDFGAEPADQFDINDRGLISGTSFRQGGARAFRYDPYSGSLTLLDPLPTEPDSWGQAINSRGDVLGYSFVGGGLERIGVWRGTKFHTYFVEGTPEFPTISNRLRWNERGLIVITDTTDLNSYLVPRPGVRLNLADLTDGPLPVWTLILDINERGDLMGVGGESRDEISSVFLLQRVGPLDGQGRDANSVRASSPQSTAVAAEAWVGHAPALKLILQRRHGLLGEGRTDKSAHLPEE